MIVVSGVDDDSWLFHLRRMVRDAIDRRYMLPA